MANRGPADHGGGRRDGAEHGAQIARRYTQLLDSMEESLRQAIGDNIGPVNIAGAPVMLIYTVVKIIQRKLIFEMGRQDMDPNFRLACALSAVFLGCVACGLLMYTLLGNMPWRIVIPYVLMLVIAFMVVPNSRIN